MLREECGVIGILGNTDASKLAYLGLFALQHRGQEASGLVTIDRSSESESISSHKDYGLVSDVFDGFDFDNLKGDLAVGHVRYSTQGGRSLQNIQPFLFRSARFGPIAIAHNGNLTNALVLKEELENKEAFLPPAQTLKYLFTSLHVVKRRPLKSASKKSPKR